jgi:outer membrane protein TolC
MNFIAKVFTAVFYSAFALAATANLSLALDASAMPSASAAVTLEGAIKLAVENSESAHITRETSEALRAQASQGTAFKLPQISAFTGYTFMNTNMPTFPPYIVYPDQYYSSGVSVNQFVWAGGRMWDSSKLEKNLHGYSELSQRVGLRDIRRAVKTAYNYVLLSKARCEILQDRAEQRGREMQDARDIKEAGMVTSLDMRQAELTLTTARDDLTACREAYDKALIAFNDVIGVSASGKMRIPQGSLERPQGLSAGLEALTASVKSGRLLDLQAADTALKTAELKLKLTESGDYPELYLTATGGALGTPETSGTFRTWTAGALLKWDIYTGGLVKSKKTEARSNLNIARDRLEKTRKEIDSRVEKLSIGASAIDERIGAQESAVELSKKNYEDAREHYRAGTIIQTRLGEFNLTWAEVRFRLVELYFLERETQIDIEAMLE